MSELLPISVGIGLVVSLWFAEFLGLAAGGLVVPGYLALFVNQPLPVLVSLLAALLTLGVVELLARAMILYGRRRIVLLLLVGYAVGMLVRTLAPGPATAATGDASVAFIGYVIPALIAISMDRQGVLETACALLTSSVIVRLILVFVAGQELMTP